MHYNILQIFPQIKLPCVKIFHRNIQGYKYWFCVFISPQSSQDERC